MVTRLKLTGSAVIGLRCPGTGGDIKAIFTGRMIYAPSLEIGLSCLKCRNPCPIGQPEFQRNRSDSQHSRQRTRQESGRLTYLESVASRPYGQGVLIGHGCEIFSEARHCDCVGQCAANFCQHCISTWRGAWYRWVKWLRRVGWLRCVKWRSRLKWLKCINWRSRLKRQSFREQL